MNKAILALLIFALCVLGLFPSVNSASVYSNGASGFASATLSPISFLISAALLAVVVAYPRIPQTIAQGEETSIWRRLGAILLDSYAVPMIFTPWMTFLLLVAEARETGRFEWHFTRQFTRASDFAIMFPGMLAAFTAVYLYLVFSARFRLSTVGQYLFGLEVEPLPNRRPNYVWYFWRRMIEILRWPHEVLRGERNFSRPVWTDEAAGAQLIRVRTKQS